MALFRRKKEKYPAEEFALPEPPPLSDLPKQGLEKPTRLPEQLPKLPEFPDLEKRGENRIKQEFAMPEELRGPEEVDEEMEMPMPEPKVPPRLPKILPARQKRFGLSVEKPIFVKIEKFKDSIESLSEIKEKLRHASSFLQKIKEIRQQEDHELAEWEQDLENLKEKLDNIDKKLFSDIE